MTRNDALEALKRTVRGEAEGRYDTDYTYDLGWNAALREVAKLKAQPSPDVECVQKMHELESPDVVNSSDTINGVPSVLFMARNSDGEMFNYGFNSQCVRTYRYVLKEDRVEIGSAKLKQNIGDLLGEQWGGNILQRNQMAIDFTVDYMLSRNLIAQAVPEIGAKDE